MFYLMQNRSVDIYGSGWEHTRHKSNVISKKADSNVFSKYSFVLVDDERESISELLLVDEDTLLVTDSLLEGLDDELNAFIDKLLKE